MTFNEYQRKVNGTSIYPKENALTYVTIGLVNEAGEVAGKAVHIDEMCSNVEIPRYDILDELGDVMWYLAELSWLLGFELGEIYNMTKPTDRELTYDKRIFISQLSLHLTHKTGLAAGKIKKYLRGDYELTNRIKQAIGKYLSDSMNIIEMFAKDLDSSIQEVMVMNKIKLESRRDRGTLQGDGDKR